MQRREFLRLLGSAAATPMLAGPSASRAQQAGRIRHIGAIVAASPDDPEARARVAAFVEQLRQLGWTDGRNARIDIRWTGGHAGAIRTNAAELVALAPDVILSGGSSSVGPLLRATRTVPIVFAFVPDPVGSGYVDSLARPGGNATGFMQFEYNLSGKWLELLKEVAPTVTRVAVVRDASITAGIGLFAVIQSVAPSLGVEVSSINLRAAAKIEHSIAAFARVPKSGLIVTGSALTGANRDLIIALAARHKLPAVYSSRLYVNSGGLISYGANFVDQYRRAAGYVDRILRGQKPADLPVQSPTRYELAINLKTAKALGITVPQSILVRADEVIE